MISESEFAQMLIDHCIIGLNLENPIRFKSGILSPMYVNMRRCLGNVKLRNAILDSLEVEYRSKYAGSTPVLAGIATGAVPISAMLASRLGADFAYVRNEKKSHGTRDLVEGASVIYREVLLFEDVVTRAESSGPAIEAIRDAGGKVNTIFSIFSYEFFESSDTFSRLRVRHKKLLGFSALLPRVEKTFGKAAAGIVSTWHQDPDAWTQKMSA